ncbi:sodium/nucleoside cotransporter 2-like [Limulus polyphemus]|uniref:Sodium/nucleoside cotransporter 2-like n=1 Tax=Limulus polyphemus TaxID=6850 RepID=A0ABM1TJI2_LIMPO|nr:sodium/nucleoside cotransporter 2-like [Limulus polyphemus]
MASLIFTITEEQDREKDVGMQPATDFVNKAYENDLDTDDINKTVESHEKSDSVETGYLRQATRPKSFTDRILIHVTPYVKKNGKRILLGVIFVLYNIYLGFAVSLSWKETSTWCDGVKFLVIVTAVAYFLMLYYLFLKRWVFEPTFNFMAKVVRRIPYTWVAWIFVFGGLVAFLIVDTKDNRKRLVSAGGLLVLLVVGYIFSAHRRNIIWRQVLWGVMLQFVFGLIILRLPVGRKIFKCLGDKVETFLSFTDAGSSFVFGYLVTGKLEGVSQTQAGIFAFKVKLIIYWVFSDRCAMNGSFLVYVNTYLFVTVTYRNVNYWYVTGKLSIMCVIIIRIIYKTEAPLMIKPYLPLLTKSELHAVMTGGFATIAGTVLALYINIFGVSASHLLSASVMSAPAALAYSKLFYPETEQSKTKAHDIVITKGSRTYRPSFRHWLGHLQSWLRHWMQARMGIHALLLSDTTHGILRPFRNRHLHSVDSFKKQCKGHSLNSYFYSTETNALSSYFYSTETNALNSYIYSTETNALNSYFYSTETNALEAAANGASSAIKLIANIIANLVAFVAFVAFLDAIMQWCGKLIGWEFLTFEWILSKVFMPLAFLMGVDWSECGEVGQLLGLKTIVNEFVAYQKLKEMNDQNLLSIRSDAIATYALCGFSNIASIGITLGGLGAMAPERKPELAQLAVRAMLAGSAACFMTACVAGTLLEEAVFPAT